MAAVAMVELPTSQVAVGHAISPPSCLPPKGLNVVWESAGFQVCEVCVEGIYILQTLFLIVKILNFVWISVCGREAALILL
jgi:hypothetical protein